MKTKTVEDMFTELLNVSDSSENSLNEIRCRFGLDKIKPGDYCHYQDTTLDDVADDIFDDIYDEPTVIIKQEESEELGDENEEMGKQDSAKKDVMVKGKLLKS